VIEDDDEEEEEEEEEEYLWCRGGWLAKDEPVANT